MGHILVGALVMAGFLLLVDFVRKRNLNVRWWQWIITALCFVYVAFILEVILSFIAEGSPRAALVMGSIMAFFAVLWAVLLRRFVFINR